MKLYELTSVCCSPYFIMIYCTNFLVSPLGASLPPSLSVLARSIFSILNPYPSESDHQIIYEISHPIGFHEDGIGKFGG
jgi:hypothetical protein